jgi:predicted AAA+ superfamily ATPase
LKYNYFFPDNFIYVFIDEFQFIKNAWLFLKNIFDEYKWQLQIIVSGSSSLEITKNTEFLTWRAISFYIDRVSFLEFFSYNQSLTNLPNLKLDNFDEIKDFYNVFLKKLETDFISYITYWWYPEVVVNHDMKMKEIILSQIIQTYI